MASHTEALRVGDDAAKAVQKTPNRVTLDDMLAKVSDVEYVYPLKHPHLTVAIMTIENGFVLIGKSAPADPDNFDMKLGQKFAYDDCIRQMWQLEGYLLREKLHGAKA